MPKNTSVAPAMSIAILAGGQSHRLGQDKSQLILGGQTLLERSVQVLQTLANDVIVVTHPASSGVPAAAGVRIVSDAVEPAGPLSGLHAGLSNARHDYVLVVACDMPFLNLRLLRYMAVIAPGYDAIVPLWRGQVEPLHALYARKCLPAVQALLQQGGGRVVDFYPQVNVRYLEPGEVALFDPNGLSFFNINTPEDWERAQALEKSRRKS